MPSPSASRRKPSVVAGGSPSSQHAEPLLDPPFPPDLLAKAAGANLANGSTFYVTSAGSYNYAPSGSSCHSSPRAVPLRHHSVHHHHSPKLGADGFQPPLRTETFPGTMPSPGLGRAGTFHAPPSTTQSRRTTAAELPTYAFTTQPAFARSSTWTGS
jgi:hypothetical protein